jgi:hypothetical protein
MSRGNDYIGYIFFSGNTGRIAYSEFRGHDDLGRFVLPLLLNLLAGSSS